MFSCEIQKFCLKNWYKNVEISFVLQPIDVFEGDTKILNTSISFENYRNKVPFNNKNIPKKKENWN